jgi:uncharacterized delta-60 repeat protein
VQVALARYNLDGAPDSTFSGDGQVTTDFDGFNDDAFSILVQLDGKLVTVCSAKNPANFYDFAAARYPSNGTIDTTFGVAGKVRTDFGDHNFDQARSAVLQPHGKLVAAGFAISQNSLVQNFAVARYNSNGVIDASFGTGGMTQIDFGSCCQSDNKVLLQGDGKIITIGYANTESSDSDFLLARLTSTGSFDPTFGAGGKVRTSFGDLNGGANGPVFRAARTAKPGRRCANDEAAPMADKNDARRQMQNLRRASSDKISLRKASARRQHTRVRGRAQAGQREASLRRSGIRWRPLRGDGFPLSEMAARGAVVLHYYPQTRTFSCRLLNDENTPIGFGKSVALAAKRSLRATRKVGSRCAGARMRAPARENTDIRSYFDPDRPRKYRHC